MPQQERQKRHLKRATAQERSNYRKLAEYSERAATRKKSDDKIKYAALRENQEEDTLEQRYCYISLKASHFISKDAVLKIY